MTDCKTNARAETDRALVALAAARGDWIAERLRETAPDTPPLLYAMLDAPPRDRRLWPRAAPIARSTGDGDDTRVPGDLARDALAGMVRYLRLELPEMEPVPKWTGGEPTETTDRLRVTLYRQTTATSGREGDDVTIMIAYGPATEWDARVRQYREQRCRPERSLDLTRTEPRARSVAHRLGHAVASTISKGDHRLKSVRRTHRRVRWADSCGRTSSHAFDDDDDSDTDDAYPGANRGRSGGRAFDPPDKEHDEEENDEHNNDEEDDDDDDWYWNRLDAARSRSWRRRMGSGHTTISRGA
jgi:hypothetical protein